MEAKDPTLILDHWEIEQKVRRMAHQVLEEHYKEKQIVFVAVKGMGTQIAELLLREFNIASDLPATLVHLEIDKQKPLNAEIVTSEPLKFMKGKSVILIDDVLNSGRTLIYAASHLLDAGPKVLRTFVLVDRIHRKFPIRADYVGLTLSTNLKEHVQVEKEGSKFAAYLV